MDLHCPKCGEKTQTTGRFCMVCGFPLYPLEEPIPAAYSRPQSYTPKFLADKILNTRSALEGERKLVTVLFAKVVNYAAMSEHLDPEELHKIMDGAFRIMLDQIHRYDGIINQFTWDGIMALFGAPIAHEGHAPNACHAALAIRKAIREFGEEIKKGYWFDFSLCIGINPGQVVVGAIGDDLRMDYTAIGDTTNLAAELEEYAKPGTTVLSKNSHRLVRDYFECQFVGNVRVKGKSEPQEVYELIGPGGVDTRFAAAVARGLTRFVGRRNSMTRLMDLYQKACSGEGQIVGIEGDAGVGKSRLLLEFAQSLPQGDIFYLTGYCLHYGGSMVYLPIIDILKRYFGIKKDERENVIKENIKTKIVDLDIELQQYIPSYHDILSLKVEDAEYLNLAPHLKKEKTFTAIRNLFVQMSRKKTLVLAIEDLHWVDRESENFFSCLIDSIPNSRILLLLLYRPEYTHQWADKSCYTKIGLNQLDTGSSIELVRAILQDADVAPELSELILHRTSGNPLFTEEFIFALI